jgi:hypothetical protein
MRRQDRFASLGDQRTKLNQALPKMTVDETRLRGAAKRLEDEVRSKVKQRDAIAFKSIASTVSFVNCS